MGPYLRSGAGRWTVIAGIALVVVVGVVALGSVLLWVGEGSPGTPAAFRDRVAASGLTVEWSNNGPSGGDGFVVTDCGREPVSINDIEGALWITWDEQRAELTSAMVQALLACGSP